MWILSYSYLLITPSFILSNNFILKQSKILSQSFSTMMLLDSYKIDFFMAKSDKNIEQLIKQNPNLIDIIICNHISAIDFLIVMAYLQKFKIQNFNFVLKNEIIYIPGFGLIMYTNSDIKLNRKWDKDKDNLRKQINKIKVESNKDKQIILIFPEGTRLNKNKLNKAQKFSVDNNLPVFNNLLVPKTKGLWYLINYLKTSNKLGRVWDLTLVVPKFLGKSTNIIKITTQPIGPVYGIFRELELDKNNYQDLNQFKFWFLKNWKIKDNFLQNYKSFIYNKIILNDFKLIHIISIAIITLLGCISLTNKHTRRYIIISIMISYLFILFKS
jgi:1-acyl-sn-glycerol-3-phosphate acyltransferase